MHQRIGSALVQIMACDLSAPSHYLNQFWNIVNWTLGNKFQWNFRQNTPISIQENAFENVVWKMASILSWPQCVNKSKIYKPSLTLLMCTTLCFPTYHPMLLFPLLFSRNRRHSINNGKHESGCQQSYHPEPSQLDRGLKNGVSEVPPAAVYMAGILSRGWRKWEIKRWI